MSKFYVRGNIGCIIESDSADHAQEILADFLCSASEQWCIDDYDAIYLSNAVEIQEGKENE